MFYSYKFSIKSIELTRKCFKFGIFYIFVLIEGYVWGGGDLS